MPPSNRAAPQLRWLAGFGVLVAAIYALVFFTGDSRPTPKLGIDLQGGTRVTLTPRTPDGKRPSHDSLVQAQNIIDNRVNGLGVAGSEVEIDGDNLVITVPGDQSGQARALATTAKLLIRPVLQAIPAPVNPPQLPQNPPPPDASPEQKAQQEITAARTLRQSIDPQTQQLAMSTLDCHRTDPLAGNDDPNLPLVACSSDGKQVLALDKSRLDGQQIANATSDFNQQQGQYEVRLDFKSSGSDAWAKLTGDYVQQQVAFVLDSQVVSAPTVEQGPQQGGQTQITGQFTAAKAKELANSLKYGSLPLSFRTSEAQTVSATLGLASLRAGLLAGAVGLGVVLLYCLVYYRLLGLLTGLSLVASGVAVYGVMVLLGRWIGFTLDLAGIAGLIIGIGMTADSFVVFFERIKDEIRDGRTFRSAVPRGWQRARRTVLSGNAVSFIAAAVLYALAVGQVRGFAFTLGLTTILDVVVLFGVTAPLVQLAARRAFWARPRVNGLGAVQQVAEARRAAAVAEEGVKREHIAL